LVVIWPDTEERVVLERQLCIAATGFWAATASAAVEAWGAEAWVEVSVEGWTES
jgi:hypothetical protein